jgi:hypothetical protein
MLGYAGDSARPKAFAGRAVAPAPLHYAAKADEDSAAKSPVLVRKQIFTANLEIEVKNVDETILKIGNFAKDLKGYIINSSSQKSGEGKSGYLCAKIPPQNLDAFRARLKLIGTVVSDSLSGQDVTEEYYDIQTRIKNAQVLEKRLLTLVQKSGKVSDLLQVEEELSRVREKIESLQGKIKYFNTRIEMSTVNITLFEPSSAVPEKRGLFYMIKNGIFEGILLFVMSIAALLALVIVIAPWAAVAYLGYKLWLKYKK